MAITHTTQPSKSCKKERSRRCTDIAYWKYNRTRGKQEGYSKTGWENVGSIYHTESATTSVLKKEVTQLTIALSHDHLVNLHPTTKEECMRIASREGSSQMCECMLHAMDPPCSSLL